MPDLEKLYNAIQRAAETAYGNDSGDLSNERAAAIDAYLGRNTIPAPDGRSQVVDRTVYETIQWMLPSFARIFANGDDVVELPPLGPDDEKSAKQEAQYLNYLVLQKNNWFETFMTAAKDALLTKAGYLYVYREKRRQVELEKYERQTQESVAIILQDNPEVLNIEGYPDEDAQPQPMVDPMGQPMIGPDGQPVMQPPPLLYDLEIRRTKEEVSYCIEPLPPERVLVSEKHKEVQLVNCPYFEYFDWVSISDLRRDGYDVPDDVESDSDPNTAPEDAARDQYLENASERNEVDPSMRRVMTRYVWITHDYDEDGIAELNYVVIVGKGEKAIKFREETNEIPVGVLCPDPLPHRHIGQCPADNTIDIQEIKTVTIRNGIDNLQLSNNPQKFGDPTMVNLDDMLISRPGGITRTRNGAIFGQNFGVYPLPFVFPQVIEAMGYFEQMTEGRTGVNRYFQGTDQNALNKTSSGIAQLSTMAAQRVEQIARHFANGVERLFAVLHALVLKGGHKKEVVRLRGQWEQVDPATWRKRTDFRISVAYSAGNKDAQMNRLMNIAMLQEKAATGGLPIVQPQNIYETVVEITKASDISAPERFWTEPSKAPPPPPPQPDITVVTMEQIKQQTAVQTKQMDVEQKERDSVRDFELGKLKIGADAQLALQLDAQQGERQDRMEDKKQMGSRQLEHDKAALNPKFREAVTKEQEALTSQQLLQAFIQAQQQQTQQIGQMIEGLFKAMTAPRRALRGKDGRIEGTETVIQ